MQDTGVRERAGRRAVDVFVRDRVSSRITPVREWAGAFLGTNQETRI